MLFTDKDIKVDQIEENTPLSTSIQNSLDAVKYKAKRNDYDYTYGAFFSLFFKDQPVVNRAYVCHGSYVALIRHNHKILPTYVHDIHLSKRSKKDYAIFLEVMDFLVHRSPFSEAYVYAKVDKDGVLHTIHAPNAGNRHLISFNLIAARFAKDKMCLETFSKLKKEVSEEAAFLASCLVYKDKNNDYLNLCSNGDNLPIRPGSGRKKIIDSFANGTIPLLDLSEYNYVWNTFQTLISKRNFIELFGNIDSDIVEYPQLLKVAKLIDEEMENE